MGDSDSSSFDCRKFATQLQSCHAHQENKKPPVQNPSQIEDSKITDVEEYKPASDLPVPMSPEPTGSLLSDKNQMVHFAILVSSNLLLHSVIHLKHNLLAIAGGG